MSMPTAHWGNIMIMTLRVVEIVVLVRIHQAQKLLSAQIALLVLIQKLPHHLVSSVPPEHIPKRYHHLVLLAPLEAMLALVDP